MKQTIYVDVLISVNLFINYFLLTGAFIFFHHLSAKMTFYILTFISYHCLCIFTSILNTVFGILYDITAHCFILIFCDFIKVFLSQKTDGNTFSIQISN